MSGDAKGAMTYIGSFRRMLPSLFGALTLFLPSIYSAEIRRTRNETLIRPPVIDKDDIRFTRLSVGGESLWSRIHNIVQDDYGFLWFGTFDGLYRYDGYQLKRYRHERGNANSLSSDGIAALYKDWDGSLWIGTNGGLDRLEPNRDAFTHYRHHSGESESLASNSVHCVYRDRSSRLWICTSDGLDRLDTVRGTFVAYRHDPRRLNSLSSNDVVCVYEDRRGNLWVGTVEGLNKLDPTTGGFSRFLHDPANPHSIGNDFVNFILEDHSGILWFATPLGSGLSALDPKTGEFTRYSFHPEELSSQSVVGVNTIFEDQDGALWLCTVDQGLLRLDRERKTFTRYAHEPGNPDSLPHDTIQTLFEDAEGLMWLGTQSGVSRFQRGPPSFVTYKHEAGNTNSVHNDGIWSVQADSRGLLWIGDEDGLNRMDLRTGRFTFYHHDPKNPHGLSYNKVSAIREDKSGAMWFGTYGGGLDRLDRTTGRFSVYQHDAKDPYSLSSNAVLSLLLDQRGTLWVGTQGGGLDHLDTNTGRFTSYLNDRPNTNSLLMTLAEDSTGILWVGTQGNGLDRFDPKTGGFTAYRHNANNPRSLSNDKVNAIREDRQGRLWIGTQDGLDLLDRNSGTATIFTTKDGLPDNAIKTILEDTRGNLWLGTDNGLSRFDPQARIFHNYFEADGLASNFLDPYAAEGSCQTSDGEMVFGSNNGVTLFYPERVSDNPYIPPIRLTDFLLFNRPIGQGRDSPLRKSIWAIHSLTLTHRQSIFTLEFAALSYMAPEMNRYRYRLDGLETQWNEVDSSRRSATYTNLPGGKYTFRVQGSNNDGVWNSKGASLTITVLPPWWATWWFRSILSLMVVAFAFGAYRSRISQLNLRFEDRLAERTRLAQELHDTLIQDMVAVGLQLDIIDDQIGSERHPSKPTLDFVRNRVRQAISRGRHTMLELRSSTATTNDLIESWSRYAMELRTGELPSFQIFVQGERRPLHSSIRYELDYIGREAITNAFRHARANLIEVTLLYSGRVLQLVVRDDGCGMLPELISKGRPEHFGLRGMRERAERAGGRLTVRSRPGGGTEVSVTVALRG